MGRANQEQTSPLLVGEMGQHSAASWTSCHEKKVTLGLPAVLLRKLHVHEVAGGPLGPYFPVSSVPPCAQDGPLGLTRGSKGPAGLSEDTTAPGISLLSGRTVPDSGGCHQKFMPYHVP